MADCRLPSSCEEQRAKRKKRSYRCALALSSRSFRIALPSLRFAPQLAIGNEFIRTSAPPADRLWLLVGLVSNQQATLQTAKQHQPLSTKLDLLVRAQTTTFLRSARRRALWAHQRQLRLAPAV